MAPIEPHADGGRDAIAPLLLRRLDRLIAAERIYRQEGLTIGVLAAKLELTEYRLRQVINEGLGYRNFNAFLNRYRIDEAKAALADLSQREVPVLTIAMDAGFQSIGPFNRAFKADTGQTPPNSGATPSPDRHPVRPHQATSSKSANPADNSASRILRQASMAAPNLPGCNAYGASSASSCG